MKKFLVVCAALMLPCLLVRAQEAEDTETGVVLSVIPRLDLNPSLATTRDGSGDFTLGSSSLYTLFEGNLTDNLSFSVSNHWLSREPKYLYKNTWHSDDVNWTDWAYLTYATGKVEITAGKQALTIGGFEAEDYDFEAHPELNSSFWNNYQVYQWGAKVGVNVTENDIVSLQMATSPYGVHPFSSGLYNYAVEWRTSEGPLEAIISYNLVQHQKKVKGLSLKDCFHQVGTAGLRLNLEKFIVTLDLINRVGNADFDIKGITTLPSVMWNVNDNLELLCKLGWEHTYQLSPDVKRNVVNAGAAMRWYPLQDRALRLHASCGYNSFAEEVVLSFGVLYNLSLKIK